MVTVKKDPLYKSMKITREQILCVAAGLLLSAASFVQKEDFLLENDDGSYRIERPDYGNAAEDHELFYETETGKEKITVSVSSRVIHLLRRLYKTNTIKYEDIFLDQKDRDEVVAMFVALLGLIRDGRVKVTDDGDHITFIRKAKKNEVK